MWHETSKRLTSSLTNRRNDLIKDEVSESVESKDAEKLDRHIVAPCFMHLGVVLRGGELNFAAARALGFQKFTKTECGTVSSFPSSTEEVDAEGVDDQTEGPFTRSDLERVGC